MLAGLLAATDESGPPAAAPPPRTPGSVCARLNNGNSRNNNRNRANGHVRRVIEPPPLRVERETGQTRITPSSDGRRDRHQLTPEVRDTAMVAEFASASAAKQGRR